jgi:hypothetical protein
MWPELVQKHSESHRKSRVPISLSPGYRAKLMSVTVEVNKDFVEETSMRKAIFKTIYLIN